MNYAKKARAILQSNLLLHVVVLLLVLKIATLAFSISFPHNFFFADITKSSLTTLLNGERQDLGLNALTESQKLDQAAALKAEDMVSKGYFAHQSPSGTTPWHWFGQVGYAYAYAGENLAVGFIDSPEVFNAWLNSPSHKANMVNPHYTEVGTAVLQGFDGNSIVVVQLFGNPKTVATVNPKPKIVSTKQAQILKPEIQKPVVEQPTLEPKVLGTQDVAIEKPQGNTSGAWHLKWLNYIIYGNAEYLQYIAYLLLIGVAVCLLIVIVTAKDAMYRGLLIRTLAVSIILAVSLAINKDVMVYIIPHQLLI